MLIEIGELNFFSNLQSRLSSQNKEMDLTLVVKVKEVAKNLARLIGVSGKALGSLKGMKKEVQGLPEGLSSLVKVADRVKRESPFQKNPIRASPLCTIGSSQIEKRE